MRRTKRWYAAAGRASVPAFALVLASCAGGDGSSRIRIGEAAPSYRAATLQGDSMALVDLRGHAAVVNVWATWCGPCRTETPFLQSLYEQHEAEGLRVLGISVDHRGARDDIRSFLEDHDVTYPTLHDPELRAMETFHILGLPTTLLLDRSGIVRLIRTGPVSEDDEEFLNALREVLP